MAFFVWNRIVSTRFARVLGGCCVHSSPPLSGVTVLVGCAVTEADPEKFAAGCSWFGWWVAGKGRAE